MALFSPSSNALALDITGQSRTYVLSRETADSKSLMPLYEYLNFKVDSPGRDSLSFNFGGWYRHDLQDESYNGRSNDNLQYAYLSIKRWTGSTQLDLGRVRVNEGVASLQIDGVHARTDLKGGLTVAAYGGSPVETNFDTRRGDSVVGGRISEWIPGYLIIGISYLNEQNSRSSFRREGGVDIWLRPLQTLEVLGRSSYNALGRDWMQHNYYVTIGPFADLRLNGEFTQVDYKQFFTAMTTSAFTFPAIDPNETMTSTGGWIDYALTSKLTLIADYKKFRYRIAGEADFFGGNIVFAGESFGMGVNAHRMDGSTDRLNYDELGAYVSEKIAKADITLQYIRLVHKRVINGVKDSDSASAAVGYAFTPKARVAADVQYSRTPEFQYDTRAMVKLVYAFDTRFDSAAKSTQPAVKKGERAK